MSDSSPPRYRVTGRDGVEVKHNDRITDFRGDVAYFRGVSRGPEYNGTAKVVVAYSPDGSEFDCREFYERVYGLTVTLVDDTPGLVACPFCAAGVHRTQADVDTCGLIRVFGDTA